MEAFLILVATAVVALAVLMTVMSIARAERPPLRLRRELDIAAGDEQGLIESLRPVPPSPIDRNAALAEWRIEQGATE